MTQAFSHGVKGSPPDSLFSRFCLHALQVGGCNIRGIYASFVLDSWIVHFILSQPCFNFFSKHAFFLIEDFHERDLVLSLFFSRKIFSLLWRNYAAIAVLWIEFVREVRLFWDEGDRLPRMALDATPDPSTCLMHQKLQLV